MAITTKHFFVPNGMLSQSGSHIHSSPVEDIFTTDSPYLSVGSNVSYHTRIIGRSLATVEKST